MARIKTVYSSDMVCHLWANNHTHNVRTPTGNLYTENGKLFSYGSHFVIGAFIQNEKTGVRLFLWNDSKTTPTTNKHRVQAFRALNGTQRETMVRVPELSNMQLADLPFLAELCIVYAKKPLESSDKARSNREYLIGQAAQLFDTARRLLQFCGKESGNVPTVNPGMAKAEIKAVLSEIFKTEYRDKAIKSFKAAESAFTYLKDTIDRFDRENTYKPRAVEVGKQCAQLKSHISDYLRLCPMGAIKPNPVIYRINKQLESIVSRFNPLILAEKDNASRFYIAERLGHLIKEMGRYQRDKKTDKKRGFNRSIDFELSRLRDELNGYFSFVANEDTPSDSFKRLYGKCANTMHATIKAVFNRADSIVAFSGFQNQLIRLEDNNRAFVESEMAYNTWNPLHTGHLSESIKRVNGLPEYFRKRAQLAIDDANRVRGLYDAWVNRVNAEKIEKWRNGESVHLPHNVPTMARIKGDFVETSKGARVPLDHAVRLVGIAQRIAARGGENFTQGNGPMVGHFRVNSIGSDMRVTIGCHTFEPIESMRAIEMIQNLKTA